MFGYAVLIYILLQAQVSTSVETLMRQAEEDLKAERYREASQKLGQAVKRAPNNPMAWRYLGFAEERLDELDAAIAAFEKVLALAPSDPQTHLDLGSLYSRKGDTNKALALFRKGLELNPADSAGNQNYAFLLMRTGKFREAIEPLLRLKKAKIADLPIRVALIESFFKAGMSKEGQAETEELLQSRVATPEDEVKLAIVLVEDGQPNVAENVLKHALLSAPDLAEAHGMLGLLHQKQGQYEEATQELERAAQLSPGNAKYSQALAQIRLMEKGKRSENPQQATPFRNTAARVPYVGSERCAGCHGEIYERYRRTTMGRSMALAGDSESLDKITSPVTIFDQAKKRYFQVFRQGSDIYQSEYALDASGQELYRQTEKVVYAIGAGSEGIGCIVRRDNFLFEAPLSYYTRPKAWALSPGYEASNPGFSRPVLDVCIVCHSGLPQPIPQRYGLYKDPPFRELAIGCENCHGPGGLHVLERTQGAARSGDFDSTIVNPSHLPGWLADNICMNCHQGGDVRALQPGKDYLDYRPGTPLDDTVATFKVPPRRESSPQSVLLEHHFSLTLSRCYRAGKDQMRCTTCHNPHQLVTKEQKVEHYRNRCLTCHAEASCKLPIQDRLRHNPPNDCAGCHMPKRDVQEIAHAVLTNHRIVRRPDEPYPEDAFQLGQPSLSNLIHVSAIPGQDPAAVPPLTLLQAYRTLSLSHDSEYEESYTRVLRQLGRSEPDNPVVLGALAEKVMIAETPQARFQAIRYLSRAIQLGSTSPNDYLMLGDLLARSDRMSEAIDILSKGSTLFPYGAEFYQSLAVDLMSAGRHSEAVETIKKGLSICPGDTTLRVLLTKSERDQPPSPATSSSTVP
jgi:tetratricopeptide (TPR) repeat protein